MSSSRPLDALRAWRVERLPLFTFGGLSAFLALAALAATDLHPIRFLLATVLAFMLVAHFRLFDDLADRAHDRARHPERVLVGAPSVHAFRVLLICTLAMSIALLGLASQGVVPAAVVLLLHLLLFGWYAWRPTRSPAAALLSVHVVLGKYPGIVFILTLTAGGSIGSALFLLLLLVYFTFSLYELHHDPTLHPVSPLLLAVELTGWIVAAGMLAYATVGSSRSIGMTMAPAVVGGVTLVMVFSKRLAPSPVRHCSPLLFVAGAVQLLAITVRS